MKKWFKRVVISLVVLTMVAIVGAGIFLLTFDPNAYKSKLGELVYAHYGRTLTIDGEMELSLFPRLGLKVQGLSLSEVEQPNKAFIAIDSARVAVAIWPLFFKQLVVDHVLIDGFQAHVVRGGGGKLNFQNLIGDDSALPELAVLGGLAGGVQAGVNAAVSAGAMVASDGMRIDITGLDLHGGEIFLRDERSDLALRIVDINANTGRITLDQPFDIAVAARIEGDSIAASFSARSLIKLDSSAMQYAAQRLDLLVEGEFPGLHAKRLSARGNVSFDALLQSLDVSKLELGFQGDITNRDLTNVEASLAVPKLSMNPVKQQMELDDLAIRASGALRHRSFDLSLDAPSLQLSATQSQGDAVTGHWRSSGEAAWDANFRLTGLRGSPAALEMAEVKLDSSLKQGERLTTLQLMSPLVLSLTQRTAAFTALQGAVNIADAALPKGALQIPVIGSVAADLRKDRVTAKINAVLEGGAFDLDLDVTQLFARPKLEFTLAVGSLDLDTLLPASPIPALAPASPSGQGDASKSVDVTVPSVALPAETPLDFSALANLTAKGSIRVDDLRVRGLKASDVVATMQIENSRLDIVTPGTTFYQGKLVGALFIDARQDTTVGAKLTLTEASLEALLHDLADDSRLRGKGTLTLDLSATGDTPNAWRQALRGTLQTRLREGAVQGVNVAQTLRTLKAALGGKATTEPVDLARETDFSALDADILFSQGVGSVRKLNLTSPLLRINQGSPACVNLLDNTVDLVLNVRVVNTATGQGGKDLAVLKGITIPVHMSGPLENPSYRVLWNQTGSTAARHILENRIKQSLLPSSGDAASNKRTMRRVGKTLKEVLKP